MHSALESQPLISSEVRKGHDLVFCDVISSLAIGASLSVCLFQCISIGTAAVLQLQPFPCNICAVCDWSSVGMDEGLGFTKILLRLYGAVFAASVVFIELDASLVRSFILFQNWKSRQSFSLSLIINRSVLTLTFIEVFTIYLLAFC